MSSAGPGRRHCSSAAATRQGKATESASTTRPTASPYPSTINVVGVPGSVNKLTVQISGLTHPYPADLDILLVALHLA